MALSRNLLVLLIFSLFFTGCKNAIPNILENADSASASALNYSCSSATQGSVFSCFPVFSSSDGATEGLYSEALNTCPSWGSVNTATGEISFLPPFSDPVSDCTFSIMMTDSNSNPHAVTVNVTVNNSLPTVTLTPPLSILEDSGLNLILSGTNVSSSEEAQGGATYTLHPPSSGAYCGDNGSISIDSSSGAVSYTPASNYNGLCRFSVVFTDGNGGSDIYDNIDLTVNPVNDAPIISGSCDGAVDDGNAGTFSGCSLGFSDADGDSPIWSMPTNTCTWILAINSSTGAITSNPPTGSNCSFSIQASDGTANSNTIATSVVVLGPASMSLSYITVSGSSVASGSGITLTLVARDASANNLTSGGASVVFAHSGGTSTGSIGSTTDMGDGTYTATFTGLLAGSATNITATYNGSSILSALPTVQVNPGPVSLSNSVVTVSSSTVGIGQNVTLTLLARDSASNNLTGGGLTVAFSYSGGTSTGTVSSTTDVGDGTYTATFTGVGNGSPTTIQASIGGSSVTSAMPTVWVLDPPDQVDDDNSTMGFGGLLAASNVQWSGGWIELDTPGRTAGVGYFESRIMDAQSVLPWTDISWMPEAPYGKDLPNTAGLETGYLSGNVAMTNNRLLMHMDEPSWSGAASEVGDMSSYVNHGSAIMGATTAANGKFKGAGYFDGKHSGIKVPRADADLDFTTNMSFELWFKPGATIDATTNKAQFLFDKGSAWAGWMPGTGRLQFSVEKSGAAAWTASSQFTNHEYIWQMVEYLGYFYAATSHATLANPDLRICVPGSSGDPLVCDSGDWAYTGTISTPTHYEGATAITVYKGNLYIGLGTTAGRADIKICTPSTMGSGFSDLCDHTADFAMVYDGPAAQSMVTGFTVYNDKLYASLMSATASSQILVCNDADLDGQCELGEWATAYSSPAYESVYSMYVFNNKLYAATGDSAGDGDLLVCEPTTTGSATVCDSADWTVSFNGSAGLIMGTAITALNGILYVGLEGSTAGELYKCEPNIVTADNICQTGEWTLVKSFAGFNSVESLATYNGKLFVGLGWSAADGRIESCDPTMGVNEFTVRPVPIGWLGNQPSVIPSVI